MRYSLEPGTHRLPLAEGFSYYYRPAFYNGFDFDCAVEIVEHLQDEVVSRGGTTGTAADCESYVSGWIAGHIATRKGS